MGAAKKAAGDVAGVTEVPIDKLNQATGTNWNPQKTLNQDLNPWNPGQGTIGAIQNAGGDMSNAWKTSVNDPLNKVGNQISQGWKDGLDYLQSVFGKKNKGGIDALPQITAPTMVGGVGGGAGGPGGTGGPGAGMPTVQGVKIGGPTAATGSMMPNDQFRQQQLALTNNLANQANGVGPSVAENQLRSAQEQAMAQSIAMANSAPGGANPAVIRNAIQQNAQTQGGLAMQGATARMQEQQGAQALLGQTLGQGRQADFAQQQLGSQTAVEQAKLDMQANQSNADLQKSFAQIQAQYAAMGLDAQKANQMAALEIQKLQQQSALGYAGLVSGADQAYLGAILGGVGTAVGAAGALSDERQKTDVKPGDAKIRKFLDTLTVNDYEYKDEKFGKGRFVSVMAQDLEKTPVGKSMVVETEHGKMVDYGKGFGALLAAQASLNKRLAQLEKKGKK